MFGSGQGMSIFATLMAEDKMSGVFAKAAGASQTLGQKLKSTIGMGAAMQVGMGAVSSAMNMLSGSIDGAISRYDTLNNFTKVMGNLGVKSKDADDAIDILKDRLQGLPTTLNDAASGVQRLTAKNGNVKKSTKYFLAMNDAIVAGGQPAEMQASAIEQLSQSYAKGRMDMMEWRTLQQAMPGQIKQIAMAMNMTADELGEGLRNGDVAMDDFMDTIVKLDKKGVNGLKAFKDQALDATGGISTNITNFKTRIVSGITGIMEAIDEQLADNDMLTIAGMIGKATEIMGKGFEQVNEIVSHIDFKGIADAAKTYYSTIEPALKGVGKAIKTVSIFLAEHAGTLAAVIPAIMMTVAGFRAMTIIGTVAPGVMQVSKALLILAKDKMLSLLPAKLTATAAGETEAGAAGTAAAPSLIKMGAAVLMVGAGVLLAAAGLAIMAFSAIKLAEAGWPAVAVMGGLVVAMAALGAGASLIAVPLAAAGAGFVLLGAGILLASAGMAVIVLSMAKLAVSLPILAVFGMQAAAGMAALAPALVAVGVAGAAATPGMLAAGAAFVVAAGAATMLVVPLKIMRSTLKSIVGSAKSAATGIKSMKTGISVAETAMVALKTKATATVSSIKSGMNSAKNIVKNAMSGIASSMKSAGSHAFSNGHNLAMGFARGINSGMGSVIAAVNRMVAQADKATRAKAKIHSPSRVFAELGGYVAEGFALGIEDQTSLVAKAASGMVNAPSMKNGSAGMALSDDYSYGKSSISIEVPLNIDKKEFARATATAVNDEVSRVQFRNGRKLGVT